MNDQAFNMDITKICRVCLVKDSGTFNIFTTPFQEVFENLTSMKVNMANRSHILCLRCYAHLRHIHNFILRAKITENYLKLLCHHEEIKQDISSKNGFLSPLRKSQMVITDSNVLTNEFVIKIENSPEQTIKEEKDMQTDTVYNEQNDGIEVNTRFDTDSEDDKLLIEIRDEKKNRLPLEEAKSPVFVLKKEQTAKNRKGLSDITREIYVSHQEQLEELMARSKSKQYLNAVYKCHKCYKGFIDDTTYENHLKKHDEKIGPHECVICKLRYTNIQQLKSHVKNSHSRRYECQKCLHLFHTAFQAREHERWHNGFLYICQMCGHQSKTSSTHLTHKRKCYPEMKFVCNICGANFLSKFGLRLHKSKVHRFDDTEYKNGDENSDKTCALCQIVFINRNVYIKHLSICKKTCLKYKKDFQCPVCYEYIYNKSLQTHLKDNHVLVDKKKQDNKTGVYICDECTSTFKSRVVLVAHIKNIHLGIKYNKNVVCETCGKKFRSNAQMKYHQRTHTGERPFSCTICNRKFAYKNQVKVHLRKHTGEKPYSCSICDRSFSQKPALNRHLRVHTGAKPYTCTHCSKSFSQSGSLKGHINQVHLKIPYRRTEKKETKKLPSKIDFDNGP